MTSSIEQLLGGREAVIGDQFVIGEKGACGMDTSEVNFRPDEVVHVVARVFEQPSGKLHMLLLQRPTKDILKTRGLLYIQPSDSLFSSVIEVE